LGVKSEAVHVSTPGCGLAAHAPPATWAVRRRSLCSRLRLRTSHTSAAVANTGARRHTTTDPSQKSTRRTQGARIACRASHSRATRAPRRRWARTLPTEHPPEPAIEAIDPGGRQDREGVHRLAVAALASRAGAADLEVDMCRRFPIDTRGPGLGDVAEGGAALNLVAVLDLDVTRAQVQHPKHRVGHHEVRPGLQVHSLPG